VDGGGVGSGEADHLGEERRAGQMPLAGQPVDGVDFGRLEGEPEGLEGPWPRAGGPTGARPRAARC